MMPKTRTTLPIIVTLFVAVLILLIFINQREPVTAPISSNQTVLPEAIPQTIPLVGDITNADAELSGLAWYQDYLILLPQYPTFADNGSHIYALAKEDILATLAGHNSEPLHPIMIPFSIDGVSDLVPNFQGFEAIAFDGNTAWLTIEAGSRLSGMKGYVVQATLQDAPWSLNLELASLQSIPLGSDLNNKSDEALLVTAEGPVTFHEVYDSRYNETAVVHKFTDAKQIETIAFPELAYRLTDVTGLDENGRFWAINYHYPDDSNLAQDQDPLIEQFGQGQTHRQMPQVERLVPYQYNDSGIQQLAAVAPIWLSLTDAARNWEGVVYLDDRGFLLVTDKFPSTLLVFVPYPT